LVEVLLERRSSGSVLGLVAESCAGTRHEIVVVFLDTCLTLLHTPEDEGDAAEEQGAADAADNSPMTFLLESLMPPPPLLSPSWAVGGSVTTACPVVVARVLVPVEV